MRSLPFAPFPLKFGQGVIMVVMEAKKRVLGLATAARTPEQGDTFDLPHAMRLLEPSICMDQRLFQGKYEVAQVRRVIIHEPG